MKILLITDIYIHLVQLVRKVREVNQLSELVLFIKWWTNKTFEVNVPRHPPPEENIEKYVISPKIFHLKKLLKKTYGICHKEILKDIQIKYTLEGNLVLKRRNTHLKNHLSIISKTLEIITHIINIVPKPLNQKLHMIMMKR